MQNWYKPNLINEDIISQILTAMLSVSFIFIVPVIGIPGKCKKSPCCGPELFTAFVFLLQLSENSRNWGRERADISIRLNEAEHGLGRNATLASHEYPTLVRSSYAISQFQYILEVLTHKQGRRVASWLKHLLIMSRAWVWFHPLVWCVKPLFSSLLLSIAWILLKWRKLLLTHLTGSHWAILRLCYILVMVYWYSILYICAGTVVTVT